MSQHQSTGQEKVLKFVGGVLASTARTMGRQKSAEKRFAAVAGGVNGLQPRLLALHPGASASLTDGAAMAAGQIATALAALRREKHPSGRFDSAADLAGGLERMSSVVVAIANSLSTERCCTSALSSDAKSRQLLDQVARFQDQAGDVALRFYQGATQIGEAIGLVTPLSNRSFTFPAAAAGRCRGMANPTQAMSVADWAAWCAAGGAQADRPGIDEAALAEGLYCLGGLSESLSALLSALAVLLALLFIFDCPQPCGPPNNAYIGAAAAPGIPRLAAAGATAVTTTFVQPWFDIDWSYCCRRRCLLVLSRTCIQTVTTRHNVGGPIRASVAAGTALATRTGNAEIAAYRALAPAGPGIFPPVALPAPPVCAC